MYTFIIKDNGPDLDIIITRAMLVLAALASILFHGIGNYYLNLSLSVVLFLAAVFIKMLLEKSRINKFVLLSGAALILFISTHSITFALILLVYGYLVKFLYKKPVVAITDKSITVKKLFSTRLYQWNEFSNIILKDGMLTLDFKNNRLIQLIIDEDKPLIDENSFNDFCRRFIDL